MRIVLLAHSVVSCWNHGNAHFLRGVMRELLARGHAVVAGVPHDGWSLRNMREERAATDVEREFSRRFPGLREVPYDGDDVDAVLDGADVVIVHEWTDPVVIARVCGLRARGGSFVLLFHDTHHRAVSDPGAMRALDLSAFDAVLAFGETLADVYRRWGFRHVFVWHEAADTALFRPPSKEADRSGLVWIGNWGDGERSEELATYLFDPARGYPLDIHGVRYPESALQYLRQTGATYHGWVPNADVPEVFARHVATIHVPRRFYVDALPGIPTIRVFEALACGIPLLCAPWRDSENLFREGSDFLMAKDGPAMARNVRDVMNDASLRESLVEHGLETIHARHTCGHRVDELLDIIATFRVPAGEAL